MSLVDSITDSVDMNLSKLQEIVEDRGSWHTAVHGVIKSRTQLGKCTTMIKFIAKFFFCRLIIIIWHFFTLRLYGVFSCPTDSILS